LPRSPPAGPASCRILPMPFGRCRRQRRKHFKQAILRQTTDNKTRERALEILESDADAAPAKERDVYTSEWHFAVELSKELGIPLRGMLAAMPSRDWTDYRAAALVAIAQQEIASAHAEEEARRRNRRRGR